MTAQEIKSMIDHYGLVRHDDKLRITRNQDEAKANLETIKSAKQAIFSYLDEEASRAAEAQLKKKATFEAIPGVVAITKAREEWAEYRRAFNAEMETEDPILPSAPKSDLTALESRYPDAVFALKVKHQALNSENYEISSIASKAYDALCGGRDVAEVKEEYDQAHNDFVARHLWD